MRLVVTPKFSAMRIVDEVIRKQWFTFQAEAYELGLRAHAFIQNYINANHKRRGATGKLAKSITFDVSAGAGTGQIFWGIGLISELEPYWYVINYGKMITGEPFVPAKGAFIPGSFEGRRAHTALAGGVEKFNYRDGSNFGMTAKRPVRPMHYIEATRATINAELRLLIANLKRGM